MPKIKTRRGAAKRFKRTSGGNIRRSQAFRRHILTKKSSARKRRLRRAALVARADEPHIRAQLPYL